MTNEDKDQAQEDLANGLVAHAKSFCAKAREGHSSAADVSAALQLLRALGGDMNLDHQGNVATRDEIMDSLKDLDLDNLPN